MEWTDEHDVLMLREMVVSDVGRSALSMRNSALHSAESMLSSLKFIRLLRVIFSSQQLRE